MVIQNQIIMQIDQREFTIWMKKIMERFDILTDEVQKIQPRSNTVEGEELLDNQDLSQMLKISYRTLQRYRSSGKLAYYTISGKVYYKYSDVLEFIRENFSPGLNS